MLRALLLRLRRYAENPDPLANAAGTISIIVACNQPFYPLYLYAIVGAAAWPAWLTLLSTPFFVAVPVVAQRHSLVGRAILPIAGVANTVLCVKLFGVASAVELFLVPCVLLGAILFRPRERAMMMPMLALPFVAYLWLDWNIGHPVQSFSAGEYSSIVAVNAVSVAALTALIGFLFASILAERKI
jgi:hypothetical protein